MGLEHKRYKDLDINNVDPEMRSLIVETNKLSFLETVGCDYGHSYNFTYHTEGYLMGIIHDKEKYTKFDIELQKHIIKQNKKRAKIIDETEGKNFHLTCIPSEDLDVNLLTFDSYLNTNTAKGLLIIRERKSLWNNFEKFIKNYKKKFDTQ